MNSRIAFLCSFTLLFASGSFTFAQSSVATAKPVSPLQISLDLEGQPAPGVLDYLTPFRVVLTNVGKEPIRIGNPLAPEHRSGLSLELKPLGGGEPITIKQREGQEVDISYSDLFSREPVSKILTLTPGFPHYLEVDLSRIIHSGEARQLEWLNLPPPCAPGDFALSATFESPASKETETSQIWTGSVTTPELKVRLFAHRLSTPHRLLQHHFPEAALELLQENPKKWITHREEDQQWMPLHLAVIYGYLDVVKWLVEHDAPVHATDAEQRTPLHWARNPEILKVLLTASDSLDNRDGKELLQVAAKRAAINQRESDDEKSRRERLEIVKLLREAGARNSLETAIYLNEADSVLRTLIADAQKNEPDDLAAAFRLASRYGRTEICQTLLELPEIDLFEAGEQGGDPLILEALEQPALLKRFITQSQRAKREIESHEGNWSFYGKATLLHYAAERGSPETIALLIDHGFDIFATTSRESFNADLQAGPDVALDELFEEALDEESDEMPPFTALEIASRAGRGDNVLAIIEHPKFKATPRLVRWESLNNAFIALAGAISEEKGDLRKWFTALEAAGADIRRLGLAAVQNAAEQIDPDNAERNSRLREAIAILRELGAEVDLPSAVAIGDEKLVAELLNQFPADANTIGRDGVPLLHRAIVLDHSQIVTRLIEAGCDLEIQRQFEDDSPSGETALAVAARFGQLEIAKLLIECGARVNARSANGRTPLFAAIRGGDLKIAELLLENGARADIQDEEGSTIHDYWAEDNKELDNLLRKFDPSKERDPD